MFEKAVFDDLNHEENKALVKLRCVLESALIDSRFNKGVVSKSTETRLEKARVEYKKKQKIVHEYLINS